MGIGSGYANYITGGTSSLQPWYHGNAYIFIGFKKSWLNGKTIKVYWECPYSAGGKRRIEILDDYYDRASMTDFPDQADRILKGNGSLYSHEHIPAIGWHTDEVTFSASWASKEYVTVFVTVIDDGNGTYYGTWGYYNLGWIEIWQGVSKVWSMLFGLSHTGNPTWELTGTQNNYGYLGNIWHEEVNIIRELSVGKKMVTPSDEGGHWILGFWVPHVRERLTKIRASDHNTPRTILQRARDLAKAQIGEA
jgi:hypothetical protein